MSVAYPIVKKIIDWDDFIGRFEAIQNVTVMPRVSGAIVSVLFKNGQDVKAGQPLFVIDPRPFRAAYLQAVGDLDNAKAAEFIACQGNDERGKKLIVVDALSREQALTAFSARSLRCASGTRVSAASVQCWPLKGDQSTMNGGL